MRTKLAIQPRKEPVWINVSELFFDVNNFRLPEEAKRAGQEKLLEILDRDFDLLPLGRSLVDNGFFPEEPLSAIKTGPSHFVVVEGNRRLAALKLLLFPEIRRQSQDSSKWESLAVQLKYDLNQVPVLVYKSRDELTPFLGFRHIAGPVKWDPLSKARFINSLIEQQGDNVDFASVSREVGIRSEAIRENYRAYRAYLQARDDFRIDTTELEKDFSVFFRALGNSSIARFVGLRRDSGPKRLRKPIPQDKARALEEVISYVHGTKDEKPVISDSRQLSDLGEVLASKQAYQHLKTSRSLQLSWTLTGGEEQRLIDNLARASFYLDEALKDAHRHKGKEKVSDLVLRCTTTALEIARSFPEVQKKIGPS